MNTGLACIALFVKPPVPGKVKTRLAVNIGDQAACDLYSALTTHAIANATQTGITLCICHDSEDPAALPVTWREAATICLPQQGNDLGQRMKHAFTTLFAKGFEEIVLIGSDIPGLDTRYLTVAFTLLQQHNLVIGPALDGGYCLIGCRKERLCPALFEAIPWSTGQVLALTLAVAEEACLSVGLLPPLQDIDTLDDLQACISSGQLSYLPDGLNELF